MVEPITSNRYLIVPNTGDLSGAWGTAALNPNFQVIDGLFGGSLTLSLSGATTILLTTPSTTGDWVGVVGQSSNALIKFTGAQSGNAVIQFTLPGFYIVHNQCTGTAYVQLAPATGTGNRIGAPPGQKIQVFFDGTDFDYVNLGKVGELVDICGISTTQPWMQACTFLPYLVRDGSIHTSATYPQLAALLGSTFGGNGITTFAVPDSRSRVDVGIDVASVQSGTLAARLSTAFAGFNGTTMGAAGGSQLMQTHSHVMTDPGHLHTAALNSTIYTSSTGFAPGGPGVTPTSGGAVGVTIATSITGITLATAGAGGSQNVQPTIVSYLPLIKTVILVGLLVGLQYVLPSHSPTHLIDGTIATLERASDFRTGNSRSIKFPNGPDLLFG